MIFSKIHISAVVWNEEGGRCHPEAGGQGQPSGRVQADARPEPTGSVVISPPGRASGVGQREMFLWAQRISALTVPDDANIDRCQLTGPVICGLCGRRAEGHWAHGRARYRCQPGRTSATSNSSIRTR